MINMDKLTFLRKNTILGPIALMKISTLKENAESFQRIYNKNEKTQIGVDYSKAEELELYLRTKVWEQKFIIEWSMNVSEISLIEYANNKLEEKIKEEVEYERRIK